MNHVGSSVNLCAVQEGKILLLRRISQRWADGQLQIPGGKTEPGESPLAAVLRESHEELGIEIGPDDIRYIATVAVRDGDNEYFALQFQLLHPEKFKFHIMEPQKCSELVWANINNLPEDTIDPFKDVIAQTLVKGRPYIQVGYTDTACP